MSVASWSDAIAPGGSQLRIRGTVEVAEELRQAQARVDPARAVQAGQQRRGVAELLEASHRLAVRLDRLLDATGPPQRVAELVLQGHPVGEVAENAGVRAHPPLADTQGLAGGLLRLRIAAELVEEVGQLSVCLAQLYLQLGVGGPLRGQLLPEGDRTTERLHGGVGLARLPERAAQAVQRLHQVPAVEGLFARVDPEAGCPRRTSARPRPDR
jgi:hypothetical protein